MDGSPPTAKDDSQKKREFWIAALSFVAGVVAFWLVLFWMASRNSVVDGRSAWPSECLGEVVGQELGKVLDRRGNVLVFSMDGSKYKTVVADAEMRGFRNVVSRYADIEILGIQCPRSKELAGFADGVPEKFFMRVLEAHPDADAMVSFLGLPRLSAEARTRLPKLPKIIAVDLALTPRWAEMIENGTATMVIVPRFDSAFDKGPDEDCRTRLQSRYDFVTKTNVAAVVAKHRQLGIGAK